MKNKYLFALVSLLITGCSSTPSEIISPIPSPSEEAESNVAQVVLLYGQSNAVGFTQTRFLNNTRKDKASEFIDGYGDIKINFCCDQSYSSDGFVDVKCGCGQDINKFGPEVGMAEVLHNANKKNVYIIKFAQGATNLSYQWASSIGRKTAGPLYNAAIKFTLDALKELEDMDLYPEIKAVCWMQGEDDSNNGQHDFYYQNTKNFVEGLRKDLEYYMDLDGIGFVDAAILKSSIWKENETINNAKIRNASEDDLSIYLDTNTAPNKLHTNFEPVGAVDVYHYDSDSMIKLGNMFGEALIENFID